MIDVKRLTPEQLDELVHAAEVAAGVRAAAVTEAGRVYLAALQAAFDRMVALPASADDGSVRITVTLNGRSVTNTISRANVGSASFNCRLMYEGLLAAMKDRT